MTNGNRERSLSSGTGTGLACLFAVVAVMWAREANPGAQTAEAWGALWVYALALVIEWRRSGIEAAARRTLFSVVLAAGGVSLVGVCLLAWGYAVPATACTNLAIAPASPAVAAVAGLGLALLPLAGVACFGTAVPPLSAAAACVVAAVWLQPALPPLAWLPTSPVAGAALAGTLVAATMIVGCTAARGAFAAIGGLTVYFAMSVGGGVLLGRL